MRKPENYWKDWDNVKSELQSAISENGGSFPSEKKLCRLGYSSLANAIWNYHGGFPEVRSKMGYDLARRNFSNMSDEEIEKFCYATYGEGITLNELKKRDGSLHGIMKERGLLSKLNRERKTREYWADEENFERELKSVVDQNNGNLPGETFLKKHHPSLLAAIHRYYEGMIELRIKYGYKLTRRQNGYGRVWENIRNDLLKLIERNRGRFPEPGEFKKLGYGYLYTAIVKHHDGVDVVREKMGFPKRGASQSNSLLEQYASEK